MGYAVLITLILDIGGLLLIYVLLRDRVKRATSSDAQILEIRDEVSRLLVELNRTTDRNIALIEDRITSLNELLSAADKKIGLLRRESEKHDVGTQVYSRLAEGRSRMKETQASAATPGGITAATPGGITVATGMPQPRQQREGQAPAGMPPAAATGMPQPRQQREGVTAGVAAGGGAPPLSVELSERPDILRLEREEMPQPRQEREGVAAGMPAGSSDLHQRVIMLHNAGFAASLIAGRVGVPLGEVELIISLQQRKARV